MNITSKLLCAVASIAVVTGGFLATESQAASRVAQYATLDYDVVYVRCPRGNETVNVMGRGDNLNWNGVNDIWLSASNNIYHQPGCDLVLHHSDSGYKGGLPAGDPGREEVLVDCDETNTSAPVCTTVDPNVSFDGRYVVYSKFTDTRSFVTNLGVADLKSPGIQSYMRLYPNGDGPGSTYAHSAADAVPRPYAAPAYIYVYDLVNRSERQVSPTGGFLGGLAYPGRDPEWHGNMPVIDNGPFFMSDGRIGFTSNRASFVTFQLFAMDRNGENLALLGHRAMGSQLHPATLKDGRAVYTSYDGDTLHKTQNNNFSLFTINPDGSNPFILAGKLDASHWSYHFTTQLSDGDVVVALYYNRNNTGLGTLLRFPVDPSGPDFINLGGTLTNNVEVDGSLWTAGTSLIPMARRGQFNLTPETSPNDLQVPPYESSADFWDHPSRVTGGRTITIAGQTLTVDDKLITMRGRMTHPAAAPDNDLLLTYTIGGSSQRPDSTFKTSLADTMEMIGKDGGIWLLPLEPNSTRQVGHIADDGRIVVDHPEYHEIMARPVVPYARIYGAAQPTQVAPTPNSGTQDVRLVAGEPYGLSGAATMYDRETRSLNGTPWNAKEGGSMSGRTYTNIATSGAELAIFDNDEIYGIRVLLPTIHYPNDRAEYITQETWAGKQAHHMRILGEFAVRKPDGTPLDGQGNPDTSFMAKIPADTPFMFQTLDKRGMALDIETSSRTVARGEQQLCGGCHVHTRESLDPFNSVAKVDTSAPFADFTGDSAPLFSKLDANGNPVAEPANVIYSDTEAPGVSSHRSFAVDWRNGVSDVIQTRCASCHAEGKSAQQLTGLRLDGDDRTYDLLVTNKYKREDNVTVNSSTKPGDGLSDVKNNTAGTDRITPRQPCCTPSRWLSLNSARSSMLVWAMYGERMDGRDPNTGLPPAGSGVLVDPDGKDYPEVWPKVTEHAAYVSSMPESEKRLIARWVDLGAPRVNIHDDKARPVLTITPVLASGSVRTVLVGLWDDSPLDYASFKVTANGLDITPAISGTPDVVSVDLGTTVTELNADTLEFTFEIWDDPDRSLSVVSPGVAAANRTRKSRTGRGLLAAVNALPNSAPTATSANITTDADTVSAGVLPTVVDPDVGDTHVITIVSQPTRGTAVVANNQLVYTPDPGYVGSDNFVFRATDLGGLWVEGSAAVTVRTPSGPTNAAPTTTGASISTTRDTTSARVIPSVTDPDAGDSHVFAIVTQPANGVAAVVNNGFVYTPASGYVGLDSFTYRATDSGGLSVQGTAVVTVSLPGGGGGGGTTSTAATGGGAFGALEFMFAMCVLAWTGLRRQRRLPYKVPHA